MVETVTATGAKLKENMTWEEAARYIIFTLPANGWWETQRQAQMRAVLKAGLPEDMHWKVSGGIGVDQINAVAASLKDPTVTCAAMFLIFQDVT